MITILAVALGGALGSVARYLVVKAFSESLGAGFPYGTLAVNVLGCFAAGSLYALLVERMGAANEWRGLVLVGFLGGFTTFSAFSIETFNLMEEGAWAKAGMNVSLSVILCILATWIGVSIAKQL